MKKDDLEIFIEEMKGESPELAEDFEDGYLHFKIGVTLRHTREEMCITQDQVARQLKTTKAMISRMENNAGDIRLSSLAKYAKALGRKITLEVR